jgi:hypothetical protein
MYTPWWHALRQGLLLTMDIPHGISPQVTYIKYKSSMYQLWMNNTRSDPGYRDSALVCVCAPLLILSMCTLCMFIRMPLVLNMHMTLPQFAARTSGVGTGVLFNRVSTREVELRIAEAGVTVKVTVGFYKTWLVCGRRTGR